MPDIHGEFPAPTEAEIETMRPRITAFIFPSIPRQDFELEAVEKAIKFQIAHEKTQAAAFNGQVMPDGVKSFTIGSFSMSFGEAGNDYRLSKRNICPSAYGVLLEAGLLYKGVEGRVPHCHELD